VGDAAFKEKCYIRMKDLLNQGKTLFLVSHKEKDLKEFCTRGLYLKNGTLAVDGTLSQALSAYHNDSGVFDD
jgi:ABC-2 type transport system ATP-binding protein